MDQITNATTLDTITVSLVARQSRTNDGTASIPDQLAAMRAWCEQRGYIVGAEYVEPDTSGRKPLAKRKGLRLAVEDVEAGRAQMILTAYYDRFVRSVLTRAEPHGAEVMTMDLGKTSDATPVSKFTGVVLAAAAELIAEQAAEKTMVSKQRNIDNGVPPFPHITPAYVRRSDGTLAPHPVNAALIQEAIQMRLHEQASYVELARWLNEQPLMSDPDENGAMTPMVITPSGVESMFRSRLLIGEIHFGSFKPNLKAGRRWAGTITDRATFRKLSRRAPRGRQAKSPQLLARLGVLLCDTCGARMTVNTVGGKYPQYRCGNTLCARRAMINVDAADLVVADATIAATQQVEGRDDHDAEVEQAAAERKAATVAYDNAIDLLTGREDTESARAKLDQLEAARDAAVERHERLLALVKPDLVITTRDDWNALSLAARRELIQLAVVSARVQPGRGPGRVTVVSRTPT